MNRLQSFWDKLLTWLRVKPIVCGLDISDQAVRLVYFDGGIWRLNAVRLEPGTLAGGKIKDRAKFLAALMSLRQSSKFGGINKNKKKIGVVVSLSSVNVYGQVFNLPALNREELAKAVALNLQMASPGEASKTYADWQIVGKNEASSETEVLSYFIEKDVVDDMVQALLDGGFLTMALEPRALALTRILREKGSGVDAGKSYLLVSVDNAGIDFLVIRHGDPYFEYSNRWAEIAGASGEIAKPDFEAELAASLRRVLNFYNQHWKEPIAAVIIAAIGLQDEIEKTVATNAALPTVRLTLEMGQPISSEWLVGLGCSLRGMHEKISGHEANLLGEEWGDRARKEQMVHFLQFWQVLVPVLSGILILMFLVAAGFLGNTKTSIEAASSFNAISAQTEDIADLQASSTAFNQEVAMIQGIEQSTGQVSGALSKITSLAQSNGVAISHLTLPGGNAPITLSGTASSEDRILAFKEALMADSDISAVNLPITGIEQNGGTYAFSMTFVYTSAN